MDVAFPYRAMARNNALANERLLNACTSLTPDEWAATRTGFFPTLRATMNHILIVDHFYVDAMEGGSLGPQAWENEEPCASPEVLRIAQRAVDERLLVLVGRLDAAGLAAPVVLNCGASLQHERMDRLLLHLFNHQSHHRGQAHSMLSGTSVAPPQLDEFFTAGDQHRRRAEVASLGWSEDSIWGGHNLQGP